jgi:hypothetical protein
MSRVIVKSEGRLDMTNLGIRRKISVEYKELSSFYREQSKTAVSTTTISPEAAAALASLKESGGGGSGVFKGVKDELIFEASSSAPEYLTEIITELRAVFGLGSEIKGFSTRIFPPAKSISSKVTTIDRVPLQLASVIANRIILVVGSDELLKIYASGGGGSTGVANKAGKGELKLRDGWAYMTPLLSASGIDIAWDDTASISDPPRPGFRAKPSPKHPKSRYVIVLEGISDEGVVMKALGVSQGPVVDEVVVNEVALDEQLDETSTTLNDAGVEAVVVLDENLEKASTAVNQIVTDTGVDAAVVLDETPAIVNQVVTNVIKDVDDTGIDVALILDEKLEEASTNIEDAVEATDRTLHKVASAIETVENKVDRTAISTLGYIESSLGTLSSTLFSAFKSDE